MSTLYDQEENAASNLVKRIASFKPDEKAIIRLGGGVGTGRTTVLLMAIQPLREQKFIPIILPNEQSEFETGSMLLARFVDQVPTNCLSEIDVGLIGDARSPWDEKFSHLSQFVESHKDEIVLLCDEPYYWPRLERNKQEVESSDSIRLSQWLFREAKCRRIVTGDIPDGHQYLKTYTPKFSVSPIGLLGESGRWGAADEIAKSLAYSRIGGGEYRSVMEIRLSVAMAWLFSPAYSAMELERSSNASALLLRLLDHLEDEALANANFRTFTNALTRMTIGRGQWSDELLASACPQLRPIDRDVLVNTLCEQWDGGFNLHPLVRYEILSRSADATKRKKSLLWRIAPEEHEEVHSELFKQYASTNPGESLADDLDYLAHWALSGRGNVTIDNDRIHFVEQLHEIGFRLSYRHRKHHKAVEIYRLALQFDVNNARSHHYYAFNLDWQAEEPELVETHYQKAIELKPNHPWYHSRWISYLVTRGQNKKAWEGWRQALDALEVSSASPDYIFLSLHRWVARWMLHWDELRMAESVLRSIKPGLKDDSIQRLFDLLVALRLAEEGIAVFPLSIAASDWWRAEGHTGLPAEIDGRRLVAYPCRISSVQEGKIYIAKGVPNKNSRYGFEVDNVEFDVDELASLAINFSLSDLSEGRFLELGYYGDKGLIAVGIHTSLQIDDPTLLPLVPPPDRWYERAVKKIGKPE